MTKKKVIYQLWESDDSMTLASKEHVGRQSWIVGAPNENPKMISEFTLEYTDFSDLNTQLEGIKMEHINSKSKDGEDEEK